MATANSFRVAIIILFLGFILFGCGSVSQQPANVDPIPTPTEPTFIDDGITGGTFSSSAGTFVATVSADSIPAGLRAQPAVSAVSPDTGKLLSGSETLISQGFDFDLHTIDNFYSSAGVEITIACDLSSVPADKRKSPYVYAKIYHPGSEASIPLMGTISGSTLKLDLKGLAQRAIFTVVYNPNVRTVSSGPSIGGFSTKIPPWDTNRWVVAYDTTDNNILTAAGQVLGVAPDTITDAQIDAVIKSKICDNAAMAGSIYEAAGFRQPNLAVSNDPALTGGGGPVFVIYPASGGSFFRPGRPDNNIDNMGYSYGALFIDPARMADTASGEIGSALASVAHEMFHAIQKGYDIGSGITAKGFIEGPAATYGITIDRGTAEPTVRTADTSEIQLMSTFLGCPNTEDKSYAYANQDFFAFVGRAYNSNSLGYLKDVFEQMKTDVDALVAGGETDARISPPRKTLLDSLNTALSTRLGHDLPAVYFSFVKERALEHSSASRLRSGEPAFMNLNENLFHPGAITKVSVNPETLPDASVTGSFGSVSPYSSRALVITPSKAVDGQAACLIISSTVGALGSNIKAVLYRNGAGEELTGPKTLLDFGKTTDDILTLLVSSVDYENPMVINYALSATTEGSGSNTFSAEGELDGNAYSFSPTSILGALSTYTGTVSRTGLPAIMAVEGGLTEIDKPLIMLVTDPAKISSLGGTFTMNEGDQVFEPGKTAAATLGFSTPAVKNADDGSNVGFSSVSGTITFTRYSSSAGGRLTGTFSANLSGTQTTSLAGETHQSRTVTGTMSGSFSVELSAAETLSAAGKIFNVKFKPDI